MTETTFGGMVMPTDVLRYARALGFDAAGVIPVGLPRHSVAYEAWLAAGHHGEMTYLAARSAERADPARLADGARSMILLAANYKPGSLPSHWGEAGHGRIARYAWPADYHFIVKAALYELDAFIRAQSGRSALGRACVDTTPLLERDFAAQAGLGFIGRNTCLISPGLGSWTFLAALLVPEQINDSREMGSGPMTKGDPRISSSRIVDGPLPSIHRRPSVIGCGRCTRCLDACPARAFPSPYVLDARRCISYLTIELRGPIPRELRPLMGNWVFGCDVCQEVCPYNRVAPAAAWPALAPDPARESPSLLDLLALDEAGFRARFRGTAVLRCKRRGLVRNACVAAGNWGNPAAVPLLCGLLDDGEPLVRGHAAWALGRIGGPEAVSALGHAAAHEPDTWVREEIAFALRQKLI